MFALHVFMSMSNNYIFVWVHLRLHNLLLIMIGSKGSNYEKSGPFIPSAILSVIPHSQCTPLERWLFGLSSLEHTFLGCPVSQIRVLMSLTRSGDKSVLAHFEQPHLNSANASKGAPINVRTCCNGATALLYYLCKVGLPGAAFTAAVKVALFIDPDR